eukprot:scaffold13602_cov131-Isochrysis_galbana.AAC.6
MRCLRPCTPPVRLFSVYSLHVQPSIRQAPAGHLILGGRAPSAYSLMFVALLRHLHATFEHCLDDITLWEDQAPRWAQAILARLGPH